MRIVALGGRMRAVPVGSLQLGRIFELGSPKSHFIPGRVVGSLSVRPLWQTPKSNGELNSYRRAS